MRPQPDDERRQFHIGLADHFRSGRHGTAASGAGAGEVESGGRQEQSHHYRYGGGDSRSCDGQRESERDAPIHDGVRRGLSEGFETTKTFDNGSTIVTENDGSTKNALAKAFESLSNVALENITDKISKESYYIRVPAGTEFYLYIEQVTDVEKAAIADTVLNNLEQVKLAREQKNNSADSSVERASQLHDALGGVFPKSLQKELKGIR